MNLTHIFLTCLCTFSVFSSTATTNPTSSIVEFATSIVIDALTYGTPTLRPRPSPENSFTSVGTTLSFSNTPARPEYRQVELIQSGPSTTTDFTALEPATQKAFRDYTAERWAAILENHFTELQVYGDHTNSLFSAENEHAKFQEALITSIELLPSESFRQAIATWPNFDRSMILLDNEIRADPTLKDLYTAISKHIFNKDHSLAQRIGKKPFDVVNYIQSNAKKAHKRLYEKNALDQRAINQTAFSADKVTALKKECLQLKNELAAYIHASTTPGTHKEYQELLTTVRMLESQLTPATQLPATMYNYPQSPTQLYRLNENRVMGFVGYTDSATIPGSYLTGNKAQITLYRAIDKTTAKAASLNTATSANPLNKAVAESIVDTIHTHAYQAQKATQEGDLVTALQEIHSCVDLQIYAKSIANGTFNYAHHFSPDVLQKLEISTHQTFDSTVRKITAERIRHFPACTGTCAQQPLHYQDIILHRTIMRASDLQNALKEVRLGNHNITVKDYKLSEKAQQLCAQHNISTTTLTRCVGNQYQQVRHAQVVALINQSTELCTQYPSSYLVSETADVIMDLTKHAGNSLSAGNIEQSMALDSTAHAVFNMTSTVLLENGLQQVNTIRAAARGIVVHSVEAAVHLPHTVYNVGQFVYTNKEVIAHETILLLRDLSNAITAADEINAMSLRGLTLAESDAQILAKIGPMAKRVTALADHLQQLATETVNKVIAMPPEERADYFAKAIAETLVYDNAFKALGCAVNLAAQGTRTIASIAPKVSAQAFEAVSSTWASSLTTLTKSLAEAELEMLAKIQLENPFPLAAGAPYNNPLMHFSDALIEKTGADKIAARATEITAQAEKAAITPTVNSAGQQLSKKALQLFEKLKNLPAACAELHPGLGDSKTLEQLLAKVKLPRCRR